MRRTGLSLVELLTTLAVVAVVVGIATVKIINVQKQAQFAAAKAQEDQLNGTLANWLAAGGSMGTDTYSSDMLDMFNSNAAYSFSLPGNISRKLVDGGNSNQVRLNLSSDTQTTTSLGVSKRGIYIGNNKSFFANYIARAPFKRWGVAPVIGDKIPIYYIGCNDTTRAPVLRASGSTQTMVLESIYCCVDNMALTATMTVTGGTTDSITNLIENGGMYVSADPLSLDVSDYSNLYMIEIFDGPALDKNSSRAYTVSKFQYLPTWNALKAQLR